MVESHGAKAVDDWSPDGQTLLFSQWMGGGVDVWELPLSGERMPVTVLDADHVEFFAKFSPNGRFIAYVSTESGRTEVFVEPYPAPTGKWQISTDGGGYPLWASSGRELFYLTTDGTVMAVDIEAEEASLSPGVPTALFEANPLFGSHSQAFPLLDMPYAVSADGQRFLINESLADSQDDPTAVELANVTVVL